MNWGSFGWGVITGVLAASVVCIVVGLILTLSAKAAGEASD